MPSNLFQKLLLHILEKRKEFAWQLARLYIPGRLRSLHRNWRRLAVYQWWDSKAWYFEYWYVVYGRETGFGFGIVHNNWIFRNGEILSQMVTTLARKYPRTEASLIVSLAVIKMPTFARCLEGRSHSNRKVNYELKHYSLELVSWKLLSLLKSRNIVYSICSAHLSDEWTFQRAFVVEHNAHENLKNEC